jgi:hypothetical protein
LVPKVGQQREKTNHARCVLDEPSLPGHHVLGASVLVARGGPLPSQ